VAAFVTCLAYPNSLHETIFMNSDFAASIPLGSCSHLGNARLNVI
jgi:hypothetical protein